MRLVCPNCGAQYEVPVDVIPQNGRDVQCSSCGHTWFQPHPENDAALAEELDQVPDQAAYSDDLPDAAEPDHDHDHENDPSVATDPAEIEFEDETETEIETDTWDDPQDNSFEPDEPEQEQAEQAPYPDAYADEWDENDPSDDEEEEDYSPQPDTHAAPTRRQLDPSISDLLRQEAEREAQARASEGSGGLEHQPDLGLGEPEDEATRRARESRARMARLRGEEQEPAETAPVSPSRAAIAAAATGAVATNSGGRSRRDLLPDIEEINSTLRSASDRSRPAEADDHDTPGRPATNRSRANRQGKNGGRRAFAFILLVFAFLLCLYVFAPQIGRAVPALSDIMENYVSAVNKLRFWMDGQIQDLMVWLDGKATQSASGTAAPDVADSAVTD